jgi:hypothetical protein
VQQLLGRDRRAANLGIQLAEFGAERVQRAIRDASDQAQRGCLGDPIIWSDVAEQTSRRSSAALLFPIRRVIESEASTLYKGTFQHHAKGQFAQHHFALHSCSCSRLLEAAARALPAALLRFQI